MDWVFGFFVFAAVFFAAAAILNVMAKRQADFRVVGGSANDLVALLEQSGALSSGWKRTQGKGNINLKLGFLRGGRAGRPVLSIDVADVPEGAHVTVWMSEWKTAVGKIIEPAHTIPVILRRNRIVKLLDGVTDPIQPDSAAPAVAAYQQGGQPQQPNPHAPQYPSQQQYPAGQPQYGYQQPGGQGGVPQQVPPQQPGQFGQG